jgi:D-alanyl-D-alanine dipeptidase
MATLLIIMSITVIAVRPLNAQTYKINKYGLKVIQEKRGYQKRIQSDPDLALLPLDSLIYDLKTDFVYATRNNFTHKVLYLHPRAYLRKPAALALQKIAAGLRQSGYGLLIYDAYRPYSVTEQMWQIVPDNRYAADPSHGSGHNKGISVDLSLYDLQTGRPIPMPTGFDNFTPKAHQGYQHLPDRIKQNRALLKKAMVAGGFTPLSTEWWHYSYAGKTPRGNSYLLMNLDFVSLSGPDR